MTDETPADHDQYKVVDVTYTLSKVKDGYGWDVDCWLSDDTNHWHVWKRDYEAAKAEFERWRPK